MAEIDIAKTIANAQYPQPVAKPQAIDRNTVAISSALPGIERKRTSEKLPATATPIPRFPFTNNMTAITTEGKITKVVAKERDVLEESRYKKEIIQPQASEVKKHISISVNVIEVEVVVIIELNILCPFLNDICINFSIFRKRCSCCIYFM